MKRPFWKALDKHIRLLILSACATAFLSTPALSAVILQYHHVSTTTPASTSISPELFETHLDFIRQNGYSVWPLPKIIDHLKSSQALPDKIVAITFDDAYDSIYSVAYPLLKQRNMPFTVFVATQPLQQKLVSFMTWAQLREMSKHGATIANHTHSHAHLVRKQRGETEDAWQHRVSQEITSAESILKENLDEVPKLLAYPYGEFTTEIQKIVTELGYSAFGQQSGPVGPGMPLTELPRFPMTNRFGAMDQFRLKVASLPLAASSIAPSGRIIETDRNMQDLRDRLTINFHKSIPGITCFFAGNPVDSVQADRKIVIESLPTLPVGRSRINCTAPSSEKNRFYWFSHFWMKPHENGDWYEEQ